MTCPEYADLINNAIGAITALGLAAIFVWMSK